MLVVYDYRDKLFGGRPISIRNATLLVMLLVMPSILSAVMFTATNIEQKGPCSSPKCLASNHN